MKKTVLIFIISVILLSCNRSRSNHSASLIPYQADSLAYAKGFVIEDFGDYRVLTVLNPWQQSREIVFQYILGKDQSMVPTNLSHLPFIKIPVKNVVTLSTTHIAFIDTLAGIQSIKGVSGSRYVYNKELRKRAQSGIVWDIGYDQNLNYELIIEMKPDVIFMYGVESSVGSTIAKLYDLGLSPVMCGDYLEPHPMGKVEWVKFFGEFYDREEEAEKIFVGIDSSYKAVLESSSGLKSKPSVLSGLPWKNTWYVPGGNSFAAKLIHDAGGDYLWSDDKSEEAIPLDLESVYLKAIDADIWINPGDILTLDKLFEFEERFRYLSVFKDGSVYSNDKRTSPSGGNDYWESGVLRPDLIIGDLFAIFHPDLAPDHDFAYYRQLK